MNLEKFVIAQEESYEVALREIKEGRKRSHWMWYIFPQIKGLGYSSTAQFFAIEDRAEAEAYMKHPVLSVRLLEISEELLNIDNNDANEVFGYPDNLKLKSSMTLFSLVSRKTVFKRVLDKFFDGKIDERTVDLLK